jgi:hypothetical protein
MISADHNGTAPSRVSGSNLADHSTGQRAIDETVVDADGNASLCLTAQFRAVGEYFFGSVRHGSGHFIL